MFQAVVKEIRPNLDTPWFEGMLDDKVTEEVRNYFFSTYVEPGKLVAVDKVLSDDGLSRIITSLWENKESYEIYRTDSIIIEGHIKVKGKHNADHGIIGFVQQMENF